MPTASRLHARKGVTVINTQSVPNLLGEYGQWSVRIGPEARAACCRSRTYKGVSYACCMTEGDKYEVYLLGILSSVESIAGTCVCVAVSR